MTLSRRTLFASASALAAVSTLRIPAFAQTSGDPILMGVSGPLTGQNAQYGAEWKRGFDLALDQINAGGGIKGRPLAYTFEDTQSDPRQAVAVAQKFVADQRIVVELGDFSSAASMAASPIYQRAGLVQFGFTNSHPDFTKGGDYMWSNAPNQADDVPVLAKFAVQKLGQKKLAAIYINSDWGRTSKDLLIKAAKEEGGEVIASEAYLPDEKDFRSALVRLRDSKPDALVLISYYPDGAQIMRQVRQVDIKVPVIASGSTYHPKFLELGGDATEGVFTNANFFPEDPRPVVQNFVKSYTAKYQVAPGYYPARAYDAVILLGTVMREFGATRKAIHDGLAEVKDVPSVVFGSVTFDVPTRRVKNPAATDLVVKNGAFVLWDGSKPKSG